MRTDTPGKVHIYTGDGKGKTIAAFGLAMRASGRGLSALIIQFLKKGADFGEVVAAERLPEIRVEQYGTGRFIQGDDLTEEDVRLARLAMDRAREAISSEKFDLIILDELNVAIHFGLISLPEVLQVIDSKPSSVELVITGRWAKEQLEAKADYVTEMQAIKHPYDLGEEGRPGIEF